MKITNFMNSIASTNQVLEKGEALGGALHFLSQWGEGIPYRSGARLQRLNLNP